MKNKLFFIGIIIVSSFFLLGVNVFAGEYYVDINNPNSNDSGPGSQAQPWKTINKALKTLQAGDTGYVSPGTYNIAQGPFTGCEWCIDHPCPPGICYLNELDAFLPAIWPANSGTQTQPIKLIALSTAAQIIGKGNRPEAQDDANQVFVTGSVISIDSGKNYWQLQGFYFKEDGGVGSYDNQGFTLKDSLIFVEARRDPPLTNTGGGYMLGLYRSNDAVIDHCEIWTVSLLGGTQQLCIKNGADGTDASCFQAQYSSRVTIRNSLLYGGRNQVWQFGSNDWLFEHNQIFKTGHSIYPAAGADNWVIRYNLFSNNYNDGPYIKASCGQQGSQGGKLYNNLTIGSAIVVETGVDSNGNPCPQSAHSNLLYRNNLIVNPNSSSTPSFAFTPSDINVVDSDYNIAFAKTFSDNQKHYWQFLQGTVAGWWDLPHWQSEEYYTQLKQDPNSSYFVPQDGIDPGYNTPLQQLGQLENNDADCGVYFPDICVPEAFSNCAYPYRMRSLDDYTLKPDSILIGAGDPNFPEGSTTVGPFDNSAPSVNNPPVLAPISNQIVHVGQSIQVPISATDEDQSDHITFSYTSSPAINFGSVADSFERPGPALGPNWTIVKNSPQICNNSDFCGVGSAANRAIWTGNSFTNDQYAETTISTLNGGDVSLLLRVGPAGGYGFGSNGNSAYMFYVNSSYDYAGQIAGSIWSPPYPQVGDTIRFEAKGTTLKAYLNGNLRSTVTDATYAAGSPGLSVYTTTAKAENFSAGNFVPVLTDNGDRTGYFTFAPVTANDAGTYNITVRATDNGSPNLFSEVPFTLTVAEANHPPVVSNIGDQVVNEGVISVLPFTVTDPDGDQIASVTVENNPGFLSIVPDEGNNYNLVISPNYSQAGTYPNIRIKATDANSSPQNGYSQPFTVTVNNLSVPYFCDANGNPIGQYADYTVTEGQSVTIDVYAKENDVPNIINIFFGIVRPASSLNLIVLSNTPGVNGQLAHMKLRFTPGRSTPDDTNFILQSSDQNSNSDYLGVRIHTDRQAQPKGQGSAKGIKINSRK